MAQKAAFIKCIKKTVPRIRLDHCNFTLIDSVIAAYLKQEGLLCADRISAINQIKIAAIQSSAWTISSF